MALNLSDPKSQKALLVVLGLFAASYGYFSYIYGPKAEAVKSAEEEMNKIEQSLATARAVVQAADTLVLFEELNAREQELALLEKLIPEKEDLSELLDVITTIGQQDGVDFALFEPKAPIQHEIYQERPFALTLRGGFHQTARFLTDIAGLAQVVKPMKLSIIRDTRQDAEPSETVTAQLILTTYLMIAGPPQKPVDKKAVKK